jgi:uncharacterized membrane protein YdcZ (DUF606 family)
MAKTTFTEPPKKWYESSGFFLSAVLLIGSLWGLKEQEATSLVTAVVGLVSAGATVWHALKRSKFKGFYDWVKDSNTWVYAAGVVGAFLPNAGELFPALKGVVEAILSKNFGAIMSALVALGVIVWNVFVKPKK